MPGYKPPAKMANIVSFDSDDLPDLKNWKPGQKYRLVLDVQQVNMSLGSDHFMDPDGDTKAKANEVRASFRVLSVKPQYGGGNRPQPQAKPDKTATMNALARKAG